MKKDLGIAILALVICLFSCNSSNTDKTVVTDSTDAVLVADSSANKAGSAGKMNSDTTNHTPMNASSRTITDKDVSDFVTKAANAGMMEVELGNYAVQHAKSQRVKDFGSMMVADHIAANNELKALATSNNIPVPAAIEASDKMHVDMMEKKDGADFDKSYMDMMVNGHKKVADQFKKASTDLKEDAYKAFAAKTLPVIQKHLDSAMVIKKSM